jgi:hypothetical protein
VNLPANCKVVQLDLLKRPGTSSSGKQHHCPLRAMVKDSNNACLSGVCSLYTPQKCFILILEFIYSFYDFKEYMLSITSFKNILQYSGMEFNFDNEFYSY